MSALSVPYRSGKSSISNVVFHKLPPSETLYLETTTKIKKESMQYVEP
jgi:Ras-related GTP-binding protein C/D